MEITRESDFGAAKEVVQQLIDGLNKCETTFKGSIVTKQDTIKNLAFSGFDDSVGQAFKDRITDLKTGEFKALEDDFEGGGFKELEANAKALLNEIQVCINSKKKIAEAEEAMEKAWEWTSQYVGFDASNPNWAPSYQGGQQGSYKSVRQKKQPDYNNAEAKKKEGEAELENGVKYANVYINKFPTIHFTGTQAETEQAKTEETSSAASTKKKSKRDEVAENFDYEALRDNIKNDLFMWGIFSATIEYNGQYIYLKDISGGCGKAFGLCDGYGQQIPGTPTFTKAEVTTNTTYPAVEKAAIDYFASH